MKILNPFLFLFLSLFCRPAFAQKATVLYDGKTGLNQWYSCDKTRSTIYEKDSRVIAAVNQSSFECFGLYFDARNLEKMRILEFQAGIENKYTEDSVTLYVSFIDAGKKATDFRRLRVGLQKGPLKMVRLPLDDTIIREIRVDFSRITSLLFYIESKRDGGFWGNLVLKNIHVN